MGQVRFGIGLAAENYFKKVTLYRERSDKDRQKFTEKIAKIDNSSIVYIDEAGVDNRLYREYGRASKGEILCRYSQVKMPENQYDWWMD